MTRTRAGVALVAVLAAVVLVVVVLAGGPGANTGGTSVLPRSPGIGRETDAPSSPTASATPLPRFATFGGALPERQLFVLASGLRVVDLRTGQLSEPPLRPTPRDTMLPTPDGFLCVCVAVRRIEGVDVASVRVDVLDARGQRQRSIPVATYRGVAAGSLGGADPPPAVAVTGSLTTDAKTVYVGVARRTRAAWELGVHVIDVPSGRQLQLRSLPRLTHVVVVNTETHPTAPEVRLSPGGNHAVIRVREADGNAVASWRHWGAAVAERRLGIVRPLVDREGWLQTRQCVEEGFAAETVYYAICAMHSPSPLVALADVGGEPGSDVRVNSFGSQTGLLGHAGQAGDVFLWNADRRRVARISVSDGKVDLRTIEELPPVPAGASFGGTSVLPPVVVSDDRIYLAAPGSRDPRASAEIASGPGAIVVLDGESLDVLATWPATAAFSSLALSRDGGSLYALGGASVDSSGQPTGEPASLTVYDASTGAVRLICGELGFESLRHVADRAATVPR